MFRSDDYDVTTCAAVTDVDFDGEKEIVLGTFGQELLVYKLIEKYEEVKKSVSDGKEDEEKVEEKDEGGLRPVHRTSIGSTSAGTTKGKSGRGSTTKK